MQCVKQQSLPKLKTSLWVTNQNDARNNITLKHHSKLARTTTASVPFSSVSACLGIQHSPKAAHRGQDFRACACFPPPQDQLWVEENSSHRIRSHGVHPEDFPGEMVCTLQSQHHRSLKERCLRGRDLSRGGLTLDLISHMPPRKAPRCGCQRSVAVASETKRRETSVV